MLPLTSSIRNMYSYCIVSILTIEIRFVYGYISKDLNNVKTCHACVKTIQLSPNLIWEILSNNDDSVKVGDLKALLGKPKINTKIVLHVLDRKALGKP